MQRSILFVHIRSKIKSIIVYVVQNHFWLKQENRPTSLKKRSDSLGFSLGNGCWRKIMSIVSSKPMGCRGIMGLQKKGRIVCEDTCCGSNNESFWIIMHDGEKSEGSAKRKDRM
jgi:hypothetical protein